MTFFLTSRHENFISRVNRFVFNIFPAYRRGGGRVVFISSDWYEVHVKIGLNWTTRNYVGSVFGGSIYAALDPIYMLQLIKILGDDYIVWDKAATIKFIRPIKTKVMAKFELSYAIVQQILAETKANGKYVITLPVEFRDKGGVVYASATKDLYIATKEYYKNRQK